MSETNVNLRQRALECSQTHLDKNAESMLDEAERLNDLTSMSLIVSRVMPSSSISERLQAKITKSVTHVTQVFEKSSSAESLRAIELLLTRSPSRLTKFHARLRSSLEMKMIESEIAARCFAALPGVLPSRLREQEYVSTFEFLLGKLKESLQKKESQSFRAITEGLIGFVAGIGRQDPKHSISIRPGPLMTIMSESAMVDKNFRLHSMHLLNKLCQCVRRRGLAWARQVCEIVETCIDVSDDTSEETTQILTYVCAQTAIEQFGFGVGMRLAPKLVPLLKKDLLLNVSSTDHLLKEASRTLNVIYASGAPMILNTKLRAELDSIVLKAAMLLAPNSSRQPSTRVILIETLTMAIRNSSESQSSVHFQVRTEGMKLLLKLANKYEYSSDVRLAAWKSLHASNLQRSGASEQGSGVMTEQVTISFHDDGNTMDVIPEHAREEITETKANRINIPTEVQTTSNLKDSMEQHVSESTSPSLPENDKHVEKSAEPKRMRVVQANTASSDSEDDIPEIV